MSLLSQPEDFQQALAAWYTTAQRPLPWRTEPSLYKTVVSELMAQQTQIKTMLPYFDRWLKRFPDFQTLADAPSEDVLKHWEGLGYYSRARNLHKLAKEYVALDPKPSGGQRVASAARHRPLHLGSDQLDRTKFSQRPWSTAMSFVSSPG